VYIDIDTALVVVPAVFSGQPYAVKEKAIEQLGVGRQLLELFAGDKLAGDTVERKLIAFVAVMIVKCLLAPVLTSIG